MDWTMPEINAPCPATRRQALERQSQLTKPPGSLGRLEDLAVHLAAMQGKAKPTLDRVWISVFAADHGIAGDRQRHCQHTVTHLPVKID